MKRNKGTLLVISGPSGVGKGTVIKQVFEEMSGLIFSISATTRSPRPGETEGVEYFFVSRETFREMIERNEFLEHAFVHNNHYGTPVKFVEDRLDEGLDVILDIDVQGAFQVMDRRPDATFIFIAPPRMDIEVLRERLQGRNTETSDMMEVRLHNAEAELDSACRYEYIVFNGTVAEAVEDLKAIITAQRCKTTKYFTGTLYPTVQN